MHLPALSSLLFFLELPIPASPHANPITRRGRNVNVTSLAATAVLPNATAVTVVAMPEHSGVARATD